MKIDFSESWGLNNSISKLLQRVSHRMHMPLSKDRVLEFDEIITANIMTTKPNSLLAAIVRQAWTEGKTFDLSGVAYGPSHFGDSKQFVSEPYPYYHFLAGFVHSQRCQRIFEIGTHFGGSTNAMLRGVAPESQAQIVTVDVMDVNTKLDKANGVTKVIGDANSEAVIKVAVATMGNAFVDLLYVDAAHEFLPTAINLGLYIFLLRPRFVLIDDIVLNDGMRSLWNVVCATQGASAINCADVVPEIRAPNVGFGLLQLR